VLEGPDFRCLKLKQGTEMKMARSWRILFLVMVLAVASISFAVGWGLETKGYFGWIIGKDYAALTKKPIAKTEAEKQILRVLGDTSSPGDVDPTLGRLLRILVEAVDAKNVVEIGTSQGSSALWISLGLLTTNGKLITHEINPERASLARANFRRAGVENIVTVVVGDAHETITNLHEPIDILFLDADKPGFLDYLNKLLPLLRPGGLILTDNASRPSQYPDFINAITTNKNLETIGLDMRGIGISLSLKKR
jgi:caffeoyl-CoA O-methyltransferase